MGEKVPFELDNAVFSSKTVNQDYRSLFINGISVDDMIQNRRSQWYLDRKQKEVQERGCVKMYTPSFLCTKPRLSQARALLFPKVFVPLGIKKISL